jgi:hypothetical protein
MWMFSKFLYTGVEQEYEYDQVNPDLPDDTNGLKLT